MKNISELTWEEYVKIKIHAKFINWDFVPENILNLMKHDLMTNKLEWSHKEIIPLWVIYNIAPLSYALEFSSEEDSLRNIELLKTLREIQDKINFWSWYSLPEEIYGTIDFKDGKYYSVLWFNKIPQLKNADTSYFWLIVSALTYLNSLNIEQLDTILQSTNSPLLVTEINKIKASKVLEK